ncbi:MAG: 3-demethylubiquinone-9 3-methyltransferase [Acidobacteria bacterium OLB17]|nr:MAG: 3-demethylubiquinone-9 3-methyltransferase [Acidobacteria bacterium OLB17]
MFNDQAAEAMEFYAAVFPDCRVVNTVPGPDGRRLGGTIEIAGDKINIFNGGDSFSFANGVSLQVRAETQEDIDRIYDGLASDGGEEQPCSWVKDKFGVSWQVVPSILLQLLSDPDREKAGRVTQAMFKMKKIIIADLEAAAAAG